MFFVVFFFILPRVWRGKSGGGGWSLLLVGPSNAGKTAMFLRLRDGDGSRNRETVTSMRPNEGDVTMRFGGVEKNIHVIDLPGHPRLESYFFKEVPRAKGIVMVVDCMDFNSSKEEVARHMYRLLTSPVVRGRGVPILVACNKSDGGAKSHSAEFIRKRLEKMVYEMYMSDRESGLDSIGNDKDEREHNIFSGKGDGFSFSDLAERRKFHRPLHVSFQKVSVKEGDLDAVKEFCLGTCKL